MPIQKWQYAAILLATLVLASYLLGSFWSTLEPEPGPGPELPVVCPGYALTLVYGAFIWPSRSDWQSLIRAQTSDILKSNLHKCANIHVVISIPATHEAASLFSLDFTPRKLAKLLTEGRDLVLSILPARVAGSSVGTTITLMHDNAFEYPGIHMMWLLAKAVRKEHAHRHLFMYMHSKGMRSGTLYYPGRQKVDIEHMRELVLGWQSVVQIFVANTTISRVGLFPAAIGWIWFNFYWVRASHLQLLVEPLRTQRRYYYEEAVARLYEKGTMVFGEPGRLQDCRTCYSLCGAGKIFEPSHIIFEDNGFTYPHSCNNVP